MQRKIATKKFYLCRNLLQSVVIIFFMLPTLTNAKEPNDTQHDYQFFLRYEVIESITTSCNYPCATPYVEKVDLYFKGGFSITENKIQGEGTITVQPSSKCTIAQQNGGGTGCSCTILGGKDGSFTITGKKSGVKAVVNDFVPTLSIKLHPTQWPDLLVNYTIMKGMANERTSPVNHYFGSYQELILKSGIVNSAFELIPIASQNWMKKSLTEKITKTFSYNFSLPAPGFTRTLKAKGVLVFLSSPFVR